MRLLKDRCPHCDSRPPWIKKWSYSTWYGRRQVAPCPSCSTKIVWAALPWRVIGGASIFILVCTFAAALRVMSLHLYLVASIAYFIVALLSTAMLRFEKAGSE